MRDPYFPFHALGFRSNPFRALTDEEWAAIVVLPAAVVDAATQGGHVQMLGDLGRGKTSTLLGLGAQLRHAGRPAAYEYLPSGADSFKSFLAGLDVFLLDEAQRLRPAERRRLLASIGDDQRLILGSHEDLSALFEQAGLALATVRLGGPDRAHLAAVLARRLDYFALEPGHPGIMLDLSALLFLEAAFGGDLRQIERFLYEVFQSIEAPGVLTADSLIAQAGSMGIPYGS